jgi:hypothetical protein
MQAVDDKIETIHLYVVREQEKQPFMVLPIVGALLCIAALIGVTYYSALHPTYQHETLTIPAQPLPPQTITVSTAIVPTGVKTHPATTAHGWLTFSNGSVIGQSIPAGFTVVANNGVPVVTDTAVYVPAATADGFGKLTASARLGRDSVNLAAYSVSLVIGSSLFVRNLVPFTGGRPAYSVKYVTEQDKQTALMQAVDQLAAIVTGLHYPCIEDHVASTNKVTIIWRCQFVTFRIPSYMHISAVHLSGKNLIVNVWFIAPAERVWVR